MVTDPWNGDIPLILTSFHFSNNRGQDRESLSTAPPTEVGMTFEPLERPFGTLDLLSLLWKRRRADVSTLLAELAMPRESFYGAVRRLEQLGLVFPHREEGWPGAGDFGVATKGGGVRAPRVGVGVLLGGAGGWGGGGPAPPPGRGPPRGAEKKPAKGSRAD